MKTLILMFSLSVEGLHVLCAFILSFCREGRYKIDLIATNGIGDGQVSITVSITNVPQCYPPGIDILGVYSIKVSLKSWATTLLI